MKFRLLLWALGFAIHVINKDQKSQIKWEVKITCWK